MPIDLRYKNKLRGQWKQSAGVLRVRGWNLMLKSVLFGEEGRILEYFLQKCPLSFGNQTLTRPVTWKKVSNFKVSFIEQLCVPSIYISSQFSEFPYGKGINKACGVVKYFVQTKKRQCLDTKCKSFFFTIIICSKLE